MFFKRLKKERKQIDIIKLQDIHVTTVFAAVVFAAKTTAKKFSNFCSPRKAQVRCKEIVLSAIFTVNDLWEIEE